MPDNKTSPFSPSGRVYVLGAGASVFAGYPLATRLQSFVRDFQTLEHGTKQVASRIFDKLSEAEVLFSKYVVRDPNGVANLEDLLTYLELYHTFPGKMFDLDPWNSADSAAVRRVVTEKFLDYQWDLNKVTWGSGKAVERVAADPKRVCAISDAWAKMINPGDVIITFNWDILHELILWRAKLWSYRDGYGFECGRQGKRDTLTRTLMLKLHGSVNWVQEDDSTAVTEIAHVADFFVGSKDWDQRSHYSQAQTDSGRKLILPTYLKDISSNKTLLELWTKSHRLLSQAKELIVVGYRLNRVDHPARLLFGTALTENTTLNEVTVVSPGPTEWGEFLFRLEKQTINVRQTFEDWVCAATISRPDSC